MATITLLDRAAIQRKPDWIRVKAPTSNEYAETKALVRKYNLHTVCEEAACPNIGECWQQKHATFMIMGSVCTRGCAFCNVATGRPDQLDPQRMNGLNSRGQQPNLAWLPRRRLLRAACAWTTSARTSPRACCAWKSRRLQTCLA